MKVQLVAIVLVAVAAIVSSQRRPDLVLDLDALQENYRVTTKALDKLQCAVEEKCLDIQESREEPQLRKLFRFNVQTWNFGTADARPPVSDKSKWSFHQCHQHLHGMDVFANFNILSKNGVVASGMKASFCLEDSMCQEEPRSAPFTCDTEQGIHVGCADLYFAGLDCQWIDVTHLRSGPYTFQVIINPKKSIKELDYGNNVAECDMEYRSSSRRIKIWNCRYAAFPQ